MDRYERLEYFNEWELGRTYEFLKYPDMPAGPRYLFVGWSEIGDDVALMKNIGDRIFYHSDWRNQWRLVKT